MSVISCVQTTGLLQLCHIAISSLLSVVSVTCLLSVLGR